MIVPYRIAEAERLYAVGDLHGRADLLAEILDLIAADAARRPELPTRLIFLGDIIDRGPQSAEVVRRLMRYTAFTDRVVVLKGNHEAVLTQILREDSDDLRSWIDVGGAETLISFGVDPELIASRKYGKIHAAARRAIPKSVLNWMRQLPLYLQSGDVVFVHAGVRPGIPMSRQHPDDLLWAGEHFRLFDGPSPVRVVHGHSIHEAGPDIRRVRIGIDTGAYRTGVLTALGLEGAEIWSLNT